MGAENLMVEIDGMSVRELKAFITEHGLRFADCVEKRDLQQRARQAQKKAPVVEKLACEAAPNVMKFAAPSLSKRAIHDLCREGNDDMVKTLLRDPTNLNVADHEGHTPLMLAAWEGHQSLVKILVASAADVDLRNKVGNSALHLASWWGRCPTIQTLLEAGASIGACDADGDFPLHHAARNNKIEAVQLLIQWGAPAGVRNKAGKTPIQLAIECNHLETALELEKATPSAAKRQGGEGHGDEPKKKKKKKQERPESENTSVYVQGMPTEELTDTWVKRVFEKAGRVFRIKLYHVGQAVKGDALITYMHEADVHKAIEIFNGHEIRTGCIIAVTRPDFSHKAANATPAAASYY